MCAGAGTWGGRGQGCAPPCLPSFPPRRHACACTCPPLSAMPSSHVRASERRLCATPPPQPQRPLIPGEGGGGRPRRRRRRRGPLPRPGAGTRRAGRRQTDCLRLGRARPHASGARAGVSCASQRASQRAGGPLRRPRPQGGAELGGRREAAQSLPSPPSALASRPVPPRFRGGTHLREGPPPPAWPRLFRPPSAPPTGGQSLQTGCQPWSPPRHDLAGQPDAFVD